MALYDYYKPSFNFSWNNEDVNEMSSAVSGNQKWHDEPGLLLSDSDDSSCCVDGGIEVIHSPVHDFDHVQGKSKCHVHFSMVYVREYAVVVGDHPVCSDYLPLTLDWQHTNEKAHDVDDYESMRLLNGRSERGRIKKLPFWKKRERLEKACPIDYSSSNCVYDDGGEESDLFDDPVDIFNDFRGSESLFDNKIGFLRGFMKVQVLED